MKILTQNKTVSFYLGRLTKAIPLFFLSTLINYTEAQLSIYFTPWVLLSPS